MQPTERSLLSGGVHKFESLTNQLAWEQERARVETHTLRLHLSGGQLQPDHDDAAWEAKVKARIFRYQVKWKT